MQPPKREEDVAVIIGRFQTHSLHIGHIELLHYTQEQHQKLVILVGCATIPGTVKDPLDYPAREKMLRKTAPDAIILPLNDKRMNKSWSSDVDAKIRDVVTPSQSVVIYGSRDSFIPHYTGSFATQELEEAGHWNATNIRKAAAIKTENSSDFRAGMIYQASNRYPTAITTVDVGVMYNDDELILVKKPHEVQWRLPGGFSEPESESFEADARREIKEELGGIEIGDIQYLGSFKIDDWRYRGNPSQIKTLLFTAKYSFGMIRATDDVSESTRMPLNKIQEHMVVPEHWKLVQRLKEHYEAN